MREPGTRMHGAGPSRQPRQLNHEQLFMVLCDLLCRLHPGHGTRSSCPRGLPEAGAGSAADGCAAGGPWHRPGSVEFEFKQPTTRKTQLTVRGGWEAVSVGV